MERVTDDVLRSSVLELAGANVATTSITCPADPAASLGIRLPHLVLLLKHTGKYVSFEVTVTDDGGRTRRFRASTFQPATRVKPFITTMPLRLDDGWNQVGRGEGGGGQGLSGARGRGWGDWAPLRASQAPLGDAWPRTHPPVPQVALDLADLTHRAYGSNFVEVQRVQARPCLLLGILVRRTAPLTPTPRPNTCPPTFPPTPAHHPLHHWPRRPIRSMRPAACGAPTSATACTPTTSCPPSLSCTCPRPRGRRGRRWRRGGRRWRRREECGVGGVRHLTALTALAPTYGTIAAAVCATRVRTRACVRARCKTKGGRAPGGRGMQGVGPTRAPASTQ